MNRVASRSSPLERLRLQLTAWYVVTLMAIIALLGGGLFVAIRGQLTHELDRSLALATTEIARAARIREIEATTAHGQAVDAVEELRIPERSLYLLDGKGNPVVPRDVPDWIHAAALVAARDTVVLGNHKVRGDRSLRYRAEVFTLASREVMVAIATADRIELEDRYASLIAAFSAAAVIALVLVAAGGWFLVRKSTEPAEESMERLRQFMADAAHELRTPITVLRSRADVTLQRPRESAVLEDALRSMDGEVRRLDRIVDDLMTLARADAGERPVDLKRVSLDDIALDAANAARAIAEAKGVSVQVTEFEEAWVDGDAALLRQLLMILLDNAVKFTPTGGTVSMAVGAHHGHSAVEVKDTGAGISAADLPRIFDRFYRGDPARTRDDASPGRNGGAGLGLSIAKWIADAHGATIRATSELSKGSVFTVRFPTTIVRGDAALSAS